MGRKGQVPWNKDRTGVYSKETRQSMGAKNIGRKPTEAQKRALRIGQERKPTEAEIEKTRIANTGRKKTEEEIENIRKSVNEGFANGRVVWNKDKKMSPEFKQKDSEAMIKYYADGGEPWNKGKTGVYSENALEKMRKARLKQVFPLTDTKIEKILQKRLREKGIKFEKHKSILGQPDIFIEQNICIFADGDYWHGNPMVFSPNDEITSSGGRKKVWEIWEKDEKINQKLIQKGYKVLRLWEEEIKNNPEKCLQKIKKIIKESRR